MALCKEIGDQNFPMLNCQLEQPTNFNCNRERPSWRVPMVYFREKSQSKSWMMVLGVPLWRNGKHNKMPRTSDFVAHSIEMTDTSYVLLIDVILKSSNITNAPVLVDPIEGPFFKGDGSAEKRRSPSSWPTIRWSWQIQWIGSMKYGGFWSFFP